MINLFAVVLTLISTIIGSLGAVFLKKGSKKISLVNMKLLFGIFLYGVSIVIYVIALKREQLSILYPIVSVAYIWISLFSMYFLKEKMNKWKWLGILAIILGITFVGFGS